MYPRRQIQLARAGDGVNPAIRKAISAPPPRPGEVRRTAISDDFGGIRFEIGRMAEHVAEARKDPVVIDCARIAASQWGKLVERLSAEAGEPVDVHNNKTIALEGIDIFCREYFCYQNDPYNAELIQTPRRMVKATRVGREVLEHLMEPFYKALEHDNPAFFRGNYPPVPMFIGDCDESATMVCAMAAALEITPVAFRFGGNEETLHHVWAYINADGNWWDSDVTEPGYRLGDYSPFDHFETYEVPMGVPA